MSFGLNNLNSFKSHFIRVGKRLNFLNFSIRMQSKHFSFKFYLKKPKFIKLSYVKKPHILLQYALRQSINEKD